MGAPYSGPLRAIGAQDFTTIEDGNIDNGELLPALTAYAQQFAQQTGLAVTLHTQDSLTPLPPATDSDLFRIAQEALSNCARHARAKNVTIRLAAESGRLMLMVADDGVGFDAESHGASGLGLITMRERTEVLGGSFSV